MDLSIDKYKINKKIGTGGFSEVFLGTHIKSSQIVAIKKVSLIQKECEETKVLSKLNLEIELMQKMKHPNIVAYVEVIRSKTNWYIVMEYCNAGTLNDVIVYNEKIQTMTLDCEENDFNREANTYYYMNQLKDALDYVRKLGYIHRDIKPMNILLTESIENISASNVMRKNFYYTEKIILKLADFGLAKSYEEDEILKNTICGSPLYMSPEIILDKEYNSKADLWSYGTIMYQLLFGFHPFDSKNLTQLKNNLKNKDINFFVNNNFSSECYNLLISLLNKNPNKRIDWDIFFTHKWFIKWNEQINKELVVLEKKKNKSIIIIPKSEPISVTKNSYINTGNSSLTFNNSGQYNSPLGLSNLSRMKLDMNFSHLTKNLTFSNQPTNYSPPEQLNRSAHRSISAPIKNLLNLNSSYSRNQYEQPMNTSRSRFFKNYNQDMENSRSLMTTYQKNQIEMSGSFSDDAIVLINNKEKK